MDIKLHSYSQLPYKRPVNEVSRVNSSFMATKRQALAKVLFGQKHSSSITFGWSKNVAPTQEKILDILTDPSIKTAFISAHTRPDGDAYGSNIGMSGILESMGVKVYSSIDNKPLSRFKRMPSAVDGVSAINYIQEPDVQLEKMKADGVKQLDVAIIADTAEPELTTEEIIKILATAKRVIVIDHHPDDKGEPTNEEKWVKAICEQGAKPENITYWREIRESAAEMIGELDKEIVDESKIRTFAQYNPEYYHDYRLAVAGGIVTDTGGINTEKGNIHNLKLARLSKKKVQAPDGKKESVTRNIFNWLVKNSNTKLSEIDIQGITRTKLEEPYSLLFDKMIAGEVQIKGVEVKPATPTDPFAYVYVYDRNCFNDLADTLNKLDPEANIKATDLLIELKKRVEEYIVKNKDIGLIALAKKVKGGHISLSLRSYGYNSLDGETYIPGHIFTNGLATIAVENIQKADLGRGGGHLDATGFFSNKGVSFHKHLLPVLKETVSKFKKTNQYPRHIPKKFQHKLEEFKANNARKINVSI